MQDEELPGVPGARAVEDVLSTDPLYRLAGGLLTRAIPLGIVLALLTVVIVLFGTASESRFIYTDF